jgi:hypothetical protein
MLSHDTCEPSPKMAGAPTVHAIVPPGELCKVVALKILLIPTDTEAHTYARCTVSSSDDGGEEEKTP